VTGADALPHASIRTVLGLLEHLRESPAGREDLYKLGGPLGYELDDLLPVTEAAKRLGLVTVAAGDIQLTGEGRTIAEADEPDRKVHLAARLRALPLIAAVVAALRGAASGRTPRADFQEALQEHFSPSETERQLQTAIDWARYGEVFDYDAEAGDFVLATAD
jgi:NitT/TauT family transport system ATP-binding protein